MLKVVFLVFFGLLMTKEGYCLFDFPEHFTSVPLETLTKLNNWTKEELIDIENQGLRSYTQQERLEDVIQRYKIEIKNGSISHAQLLERFPTEESKEINKLAVKFLKTTNIFVMKHYASNNIPAVESLKYLKDTDLPEGSQLRTECYDLNAENHSFRRLLPASYKDGLYQMNKAGLPKPTAVSELASGGDHLKEDDDNNLAFIQWAQFIEHDLVKTVVTTMHDGDTIECCDNEYFGLLPRYRHPSCEPLESVKPRKDTVDRRSCLNYVRSSLAVNKDCRLGVAEQLNQASGELDLSQLYGYTKESQNLMKSGSFLKSNGDFLPFAENRQEYCVTDTGNCYMAGDSRVNSNPYTIILYTIFLRNHNQIAESLTKKITGITTDEIFEKAKQQNVKMYRDIVFKEWLPILIGTDNMKKLTKEKLKKQRNGNFEVSNEFGVAASRFYYSMLPNSQNTKPAVQDTHPTQQKTTMFNLNEEFYASTLVDKNFDDQIEGILSQKALAMDSSYSESLLKRYFSTKQSKEFVSGADSLGWDIQIGRDHGLQGYVQYVKSCYDVKINKWADLSFAMESQSIQKLKSVYGSVNDIDLIVGGIFERIDKDASVGPTFNCILSEQFSKVRQLHYNLSGEDIIDSSSSLCDSGAALICRTTNVKDVPRNIFVTPGKGNELMTCAEVLKGC